MQVDPGGLWSFWPNEGWLRYGPSSIGFGPGGQGIYRLAFCVGSGGAHVYGLGGATCFGATVAGAAVVGAGVGTGLNWAVKKATGRSISDRLGEWTYDVTVGPRCPGYDPDPD